MKMPKKAIRRILKKKHQVKKKVKKQIKQQNNQQNQQNKPLMQPLGLGYGHQQYGNPDLAIQQMRNQNQITTDQINNYRTTIESMKKEQEKNEKELKAMKKQAKEEKRKLESAKTDYEIAKDNQEDDDAIRKLYSHYQEKSHKLELQNIEKEADVNIGETIQKIKYFEDENHRLDMENAQQRKTIELNKTAARLKELEEEHKIKLAENQGQFQYMQSKKFTNPEDELPKVFSDILNEEEMEACIKSRKNLEQETAQLMEILQQNPKDYGATQQQISSENTARIEHNVALQRVKDRYEAKNAEIRHLQQKEIDLNNKNADLEIDNAALKKWNESPEKRNVKNRAITAAKNKVQLEEEHEILQEELDAERETQKQERKNKALKATKTAFENLANDPEIQQQMEDLAQKETELKMKQEIGNELDLTIKKTKQNQQAAFANDTKANVAGAIYNGEDSSGFIIEKLNKMVFTIFLYILET